MFHDDISPPPRRSKCNPLRHLATVYIASTPALPESVGKAYAAWQSSAIAVMVRSIPARSTS